MGEKGWLTILVRTYVAGGQDLDDRGKQGPVGDVRSYAHESLPLTMKRVRNYLHTLEAFYKRPFFPSLGARRSYKRLEKIFARVMK